MKNWMTSGVSRRACLALAPALVAVLVNPLAAQAADEPTKDDAVKMVDKVVAMHKASGKEKTLELVGQKEGPFHKGELYVTAYDTTGTIIAHPINPKLVGKNMVDVPDPDGKPYRRTIVDVGNSKGSGWVDYKYRNPENNRIELKTTFFKKVGDVIYACGVYL
jgi:cytochrome c